MDKNQKKARKMLLKPYTTKKPKPANNPGKTNEHLAGINYDPNSMTRLGGW